MVDQVLKDCQDFWKCPSIVYAHYCGVSVNWGSTIYVHACGKREKIKVTTKYLKSMMYKHKFGK